MRCSAQSLVMRRFTASSSDNGRKLNLVATLANEIRDVKQYLAIQLSGFATLVASESASLAMQLRPIDIQATRPFDVPYLVVLAARGVPYGNCGLTSLAFLATSLASESTTI